VNTEAPQGSNPRRTQLIVLAVFAAVLLIGGAIALSQSGGDDDDEPSVPEGDVQALIDSLRQNGGTIGDENAPETILEYADLQCPFCRQFAVQEIPQLLEGPVADGEAKITFRNWVILGEDSETAAAAALAAGEQDRLWNFVEAFYAQQGPENSGYVTDEFLRGIAEEAEVPDLEQWEAERDPVRWSEVLKIANDEATELGFTGTPSFAIRNGTDITPLPNAATAADIQAELTGG
jgi:protein-disulfide isomerase